MQEFEVVVTKKDGTEGTYPVDLDVMCEFEEIAKIGVPVAFGHEDKVKISNLVLLGWCAEKSAGVQVKPVQQWRKSVKNIDLAQNATPT